MENHSVTMILMRLLEIEVRPPNFMRHDFYDRHDDYGSDDDDEGKDGDRRMHHMERRRMRKEPELSPEQKAMLEVLKEGQDKVLTFLMDCLSDKNDDIYLTLNSSAVCQEFCEQSVLFQMLIEKKPFEQLVAILGQQDSNKENLPHAFEVMTFIMKKYAERDAHFFKDNDKLKAFEMVSPHFKDIFYNCMHIIRS